MNIARDRLRGRWSSTASSCPYTPAGLPWNDDFDSSVVNYTPLAILVPLIFGGLVPGLGEGQVPGPVRTLEEDEVTRDVSEPVARPTAGGTAGVKLDELKKAVDDGTVDTVLLAIADMEGRLQGKRLTAAHFLDEVAEHGAEGCNYLLAVDVDMDTVDGYAMSSWSRGYGDFVMKPDFDTLRPVPWHEGTALLMADLEWEDGSRGGRLAAADPAPPARPARRARLARDGRHRARVHRLPRHLRGRLEAWLPRPRAGQPLQRRLLDARHGAGRAADPPHPQLDDAAPGWRSRTRRASATSASTRSTSTTPTRSPTADDHVIYKNGAKEIAAQEGIRDHLHGQVQRARGQLVPHPLLARRGGRRQRSSPATEQLFESFVAGQLACLRELTLFFAPQINSYKRFARGLVRPDRGRLGQRQPHLLDARRRPRRGRCGSRTGCRAPTSTPTWRWRR